jgi:hypothetical protein
MHIAFSTAFEVRAKNIEALLAASRYPSLAGETPPPAITVAVLRRETMIESLQTTKQTLCPRFPDSHHSGTASNAGMARGASAGPTKPKLCGLLVSQAVHHFHYAVS